MKKIVMPLSIAFVIGLVGCGVNENADNRTNSKNHTNRTALSEITRQVGFSTNDKNLNERKGPFTYINNVGVNENRTRDLGTTNRGYNYGHEDYNFHGQMNTTLNGKPTRSYGNANDNIIAQRIVGRLEHLPNVKDVATFIDDDTILVVLDTFDKNDANLVSTVGWIAEGMSEGRKVKVVSDMGMIQQMRNNNGEINIQ